MKRCSECGDEIGSKLICARIAERLMRVCFLCTNTYAPYSKWFGTAFNHPDIDDVIKCTIKKALSADTPIERKDKLVRAQALVADIHNKSRLTFFVENKIENYFGRDIKVIFADKLVDATVNSLKNTPFKNVPLIGSFSQFGGLSSFSDEKQFYGRIAKLYKE